jgi:hypothetical protein
VETIITSYSPKTELLTEIVYKYSKVGNIRTISNLTRNREILLLLVAVIFLKQSKSVTAGSGGWRSGKTLASHHCDLGFDSRTWRHSELSLLLILSLASRVFLRFSSLRKKNQHF